MADREHDHPSNKGLKRIGKSLFGTPSHGPSISTIAKQEFGKKTVTRQAFCTRPYLHTHRNYQLARHRRNRQIYRY